MWLNASNEKKNEKTGEKSNLFNPSYKGQPRKCQGGLLETFKGFWEWRMPLENSPSAQRKASTLNIIRGGGDLGFLFLWINIVLVFQIKQRMRAIQCYVGKCGFWLVVMVLLYLMQKIADLSWYGDFKRLPLFFLSFLSLISCYTCKSKGHNSLPLPPPNLDHFVLSHQ